MNAIETENLTRRFGRTEAVHELNLAVAEGSVTALLGANGAGKTTTLKLLMNLLRPTGGCARVLGVDSRRLGAAEFARIGYVSENQELPMWMTVGQLLDYCRPLYPTWDRDLEKSLLNQFDLSPAFRLKNLSRGMLMKAALLSSLAYRPRLLVLDEPFSGLDPVVRDDVVQGLVDTAEVGGWAVLVSSHDIAEVERLVDRVLLIDRGHLKLDESADTLVSRFRRVELTGVPAGAAALPGVLDWQCNGRQAKFVTPAYAGKLTEEYWSAAYAGAVVEVQPMTLREIFIAVARNERALAKGHAA
jgi:ABC-2 type transport system ATP-binding protein